MHGLLALGLGLACCTTSLALPSDLPFTFDRGLVVGQIGRSARSPIRFDAVEHQVVTGAFAAPGAEAEITAPDGTVQKWTTATATLEDGAAIFAQPELSGGYFFATFESDAERIALLEAKGHSMVYVNGEPHAGDPYSYGWFRIPIALRAGRNEFLFACSRGRLEAKLVPAPTGGPFFLGADDTLPDLVVGEDNDLPLSAVIVLPTGADPARMALEVRAPSGSLVSTPLAPTLPLCGTKAVGRVRCRPESTGSVPIDLVLTLDGQPVAQRSVDLAAVASTERRKVTYISSVDGSVQYYACVPHVGSERPGLLLSLHGASVEATSQAASYAPKTWATIACPTNRRPYGFDWEDWGRLDALEVMNDARIRFNTDPRRQWLTGHSMGGHGTWQLGSHFPDRFAAIAPSAGWISFSTYGGTTLSPDGTEGMFARATSASETFALKDNLAQFGIYILHGDVDDNVPVAQARRMRSALAGGDNEFHSDFVYFEKKGANHWWGNECVDWPPLMRFLQDHSLRDPETIDRVDFVTASPAVSASCHWLLIDAQRSPWQRSGASLALDRVQRTVTGTTDNIARLRLDLPLPAGPIAITIDSTTVETSVIAGSPLWLVREGDVWKVGEAPGGKAKSAIRGGSFKESLGHDLLLVYGTAGDDATDAALLAKARFDAETVWYRGNGAIDIVPDTSFEPGQFPNRGVLLIGNADTNTAWNRLLADCPVLVRNGSAKVGDQEIAGDDLVCVFTFPRTDSDTASVAVVAGTGPIGTRLSMRLPYFVSGVGFPDLCVLQAKTLLSGATGFRAAGFFGNDWSVEHGEWAVAPAP
jgi:hypothetical protein